MRVIFKRPLTRTDLKWVVAGAGLGLILLTAAYFYPTVSTTPPVKVEAKPSPSPSPSPAAHVIGEDRIVSLWTRDGLGHACPISPTEALTADHVAVMREIAWGPMGGFAPFIVWGDQLGNHGTVQWQWSDKRRDLSLVRIVPGTPFFAGHLRRAKVAPRIGDKVYVVGFKWGKGAVDWTNEAKVSGIQAGMLVYETSPGPGSSGSCVLNGNGEFVAINIWTLAGEGAGLLVVDEFAEVPDIFLEGNR